MVFKIVQKFSGWNEICLLFFGYDRSGSTVTGRIIDAHPHALIANEFILFDILADQLTGIQAVQKVCEMSTQQKKIAIQKPEGYKISMGEFGGRVLEPLRVLGVKRSLNVTTIFHQDLASFNRSIN
ncbi:uncharacterized protein LOC142355627, partial [Convolutriloba macropyga]|uniref:uncharacterized protein LOC142355627 n=1 Tax=Convolutriloba macropyga TaxID=536237 RepID=UPI003F51C1D1